MHLLEQLIATTRFSQAEHIWQEHLAHDVFEPFFACVLASMAGDGGFAYYDDFVKATQSTARASLATGGVPSSLAVFWDNPAHPIMRQKIADATLIDEAVLSAVLPLAVHSGFGLLTKIAENSGVSLQELARTALPSLLPKLPAWASLVLDEHELIRLSTPSTPDADNHSFNNNIAQDNSDTLEANDEPESLADERVMPAHHSSRNVPLLAGILGVLCLAGVAGGYVYYKKSQETPAEPVQAVAPAEPALTVQALAPSSLSMTVGQQGELYACHAELGGNGLSDKLIAFLQNNFSSTLCVIDINDSLSGELTGFDKLTSVIGLLKTAPHATLQIQGDSIYINAQNPSDVTRLVADIGTLMGGVKVLPMPVLNAQQEINTSIARASEAMDALATPLNGSALARAMSLQMMDTTQPIIPAVHQTVLAGAAERLKHATDVRLIIVAHRDEAGDAETARLQTQAFADAIKNDLVAKGVNAEQLTAIGVGAKLPAADNVTEWGRFKNRRVEFLVYDEAVVQALTNANQTAAIAPPTQNYAPTNSSIPKSYTVVNGQIVEQSVANQMLAEQAAQAQMQAQVQPQFQAPPTQTTPSAGTQIVPPLPSYQPQAQGEVVVLPQGEMRENIVVSPSISISSATPTPSAPTPATSSPIDDDLLAPIGVEPMYGSAVERANR